MNKKYKQLNIHPPKKGGANIEEKLAEIDARLLKLECKETEQKGGAYTISLKNVTKNFLDVF